MERLTAKNKHGKPIIKDWPNYMEFDIINRLVTIEDILGDEYDMDRLRELVEADKTLKEFAEDVARQFGYWRC